MALKLKGKLSMVVAAVAIMLLAACDTQPATDVTSAATLNGKGACTQGASGTWEYQVKVDDPWSGYAVSVGPRTSSDCGTPARSPSRRSRALPLPQRRYVFRLVSRLVTVGADLGRERHERRHRLRQLPHAVVSRAPFGDAIRRGHAAGKGKNDAAFFPPSP